MPGTQRQAAEDGKCSHSSLHSRKLTLATADLIPLSAPITLKDGRQINALPVKKGQDFFIPLNSVNLLTSIWGEDAKTFRPERWLSDLPDSVAAATSGYTIYSHLFTFLGGPRGCIGRMSFRFYIASADLCTVKFAILEFKAILSILIEVLHFEERDDKPEIIPKAFLVQVSLY